MVSKKILIIESDTALSNAINVEIKTKFADWQVEAVKDIAKGLKIITNSQPDFLIFGHNQLKQSHEQFLVKLNKQPLSYHLIVLSNSRLLSSKIELFNLGADHVLIKPFILEELICKIRSLLKRSQQKREIIFTSGLRYDPTSATITCQETNLVLTRKEADIFYHLISKTGNILSRSDLLDLVWPERDINPNTIEAHIESIRKKLFKLTGKHFIKTSFGFGYYFEEQNSAKLQELFDNPATI